MRYTFYHLFKYTLQPRGLQIKFSAQQSIMIPALQNIYPVIMHLVNQTVLVSNAPAPATGEITFKRFRFACSAKRRSQAFLYQVVYTFYYFFICLLPVQVIFPGNGLPFQFHYPSIKGWA